MLYCYIKKIFFGEKRSAIKFKYNKIDYKQLNINIFFEKKESLINSQLCDSFFIFKITITNDSV